MFKIICNCDDGFSMAMAYTSSTTCQELTNQLCQLRNAQKRYINPFNPESLSVVIQNQDGDIVCLLSPDVILRKMTGKKVDQIKILGFEGSEGRTKKRKKAQNEDESIQVKLPRQSAHNKKLREEAVIRNSFTPDPVELLKLKQARTHESRTIEDRDWDDRFDLMLEYGRVTGTCNVPQGVVCQMPDGSQIKLGYWLPKQRHNRKIGKLRLDREVRLQEVVDSGKLDWAMDRVQTSVKFNTDDEGWYRRFEALLKYGEEHQGNCDVPEKFETTLDDGTEVKLGQWLYHQRKAHLKQKLRADREEKLQELVDGGKLVWVVDKPSAEDKWNSQYNLLLQYSQEHNGDCNIPTPYVMTTSSGTDVRIGVWLYTQRKNKLKGTLRPDREARLQALVDKGWLSWGRSEDHSNSTTDSDDEVDTNLDFINGLAVQGLLPSIV